MAKFIINYEMRDGTIDKSDIEADTENAARSVFSDQWRTHEWRSAELVTENGTRIAVKYAEPN